jgi:hypothetical protein
MVETNTMYQGMAASISRIISPCIRFANGCGSIIGCM